jgi:CBS domain-containing protein
METRLRQLIEHKGSKIWSVPPEASVFEAITLMAERGIGVVLVMEDSAGLPAGIFSERDYARRIILQGRASRHTPVGEVMTRELTYGRPDMTIREGMHLMTQGRFRHLPVVSKGRMLGVLSIGDLVKALIEHQEFLIHQLENYITS